MGCCVPNIGDILDTCRPTEVASTLDPKLVPAMPPMKGVVADMPGTMAAQNPPPPPPPADITPSWLVPGTDPPKPAAEGAVPKGSLDAAKDGVNTCDGGGAGGSGGTSNNMAFDGGGGGGGGGGGAS